MKYFFIHAWLIFIVLTAMKAVAIRVWAKTKIADNPDLKNGYKSYFWGLLLLGNIPWVIMGIGNLSGATSSLLDFLQPRDLNPMVLAFHLYIIILYLLGGYWIYLRGGAEFIERHPGLIRSRSPTGVSEVTAKQMKFFYPLMVAGGLLAMIMMWVVDFSIPQMN